MTDLKTMIQQAQRPEKTVSLCLRGDLVARHEELQRELADLTKVASGRLTGTDSHTLKVAREIQALEEEMRGTTVDVLLRAKPRKEWNKLVAAHPPRKDHDSDKNMGVNVEAFYDAIIRACWVSPEVSEDDLTELLDAVTSRQYDDLAEAAWAVNRRDVDVPFSLTASRITQPSGGTSKRRSGSGSRTDAGAAGNPKK